MKTDDLYMQKCLELAQIALSNGDPPVGAILVFDEEIIGKGIEAGKSTGDITNHAEIMAIRDAVHNGFIAKLSSAVLYSTHEPCIMCSYVIRHHRIPKIIYGVAVDFVGGFTSPFPVLVTEDIPKWGNRPEVVTGVCENSCRSLNLQFNSIK